MRIVIVTDLSIPVHKYMCALIHKTFPLVGIVEPLLAKTRKPTSYGRISRLVRSPKGLLRGLLEKYPGTSLEGPLTSVLSGAWNLPEALHKANRRLLPDIEEIFRQEVPAEIITQQIPYAPELLGEYLKRLAPDVVICSGGPIFDEHVLSACKIVTNFHTGLSPIYNGNSTAFWCFANHQPFLAGGTYMLLSKQIDGGDILGHYLPDLAIDDDPALVFIRTIMGGTKLILQFLESLEKTQDTFVSVKQTRPLFYYRGVDWTVAQNVAIERLQKSCWWKQHRREEEFAAYWDAEDEERASKKMEQNLMRWMFRSTL